MKNMQRLFILILVLGVAYLPGVYAEENYVTSEKLSITDVKPFIEAQFLQETPIGEASGVTVKSIEQKGTRATVICDFCYPGTPFSSVKHELRNVIFERTESGKWINTASGKFLTK